jgi:hypothetical protein
MRELAIATADLGAMAWTSGFVAIWNITTIQAVAIPMAPAHPLNMEQQQRAKTAQRVLATGH